MNDGIRKHPSAFIPMFARCLPSWKHCSRSDRPFGLMHLYTTLWDSFNPRSSSYPVMSPSLDALLYLLCDRKSQPSFDADNFPSIADQWLGLEKCRNWRAPLSFSRTGDRSGAHSYPPQPLLINDQLVLPYFNKRTATTLILYPRLLFVDSENIGWRSTAGKIIRQHVMGRSYQWQLSKDALSLASVVGSLIEQAKKKKMSCQQILC